VLAMRPLVRTRRGREGRSKEVSTKGTYEVEEGKVKLTGRAVSRLLTIDGNCLGGGDGLIGPGRYGRS
jgi:hypothetical protein